MPSSIFTVSQITTYIKAVLEDNAFLSDVWLMGEISNFTQSAAGHCYFTFKDNNSCLRGVIWRSQAARVYRPRNGDSVIAHGHISLYEAQGQYQLQVDQMQPAGIGLLWQEFQQLKERLAAEGLFAEERKREIPALSYRIGIATSAGAAALRDILRTLSTRCPFAEVVLAPTLVQGDGAPPAIVAALDLLNRWSDGCERPLQVIILARGGGSIEELWAFNDERVARAIAASRVPVITGVGHETDFTIADFVADVRAATPTAAAVRATVDSAELAASIRSLLQSAEAEVGRQLQARSDAVEGLRQRLIRQSPMAQMAADRQRVDELMRRAGLATEHRLATWRHLVAAQRTHLLALHPGEVLRRGYALVTDQEGTTVSSVQRAVPGKRLRVRVSDGAFGVRVSEEEG